MATTLSKEDVVRRKHRGQIQLGLVTYSYTGDSSSEDEDDDASDIVRNGEARIAWYPKGREEVIAEDKVTLHDRCLLPGDIVKYNVSTQAQKGLVKSINVLCNLQVLTTKQMIYNIPSQELTPIVPFQVGDHVVMDDWVGIVRESYNNVVVRFKSDARCSVCEDSACRLVDVHDISDENSVFGEEVGFFPGQILQGPAAVFKGAKWLGGPRPILGSKTRFRVTVDEVKNTGLDIQWCSRAVTKNTDDLKPPPMCIKGKNLERTKLLNFSAHASVQIGDKCMYKVKEEDLGYPEPVSKGAFLCFRKPGGENSVATGLDGSMKSVTEDMKCEGKDNVQSVIIQAMKGLGLEFKNLAVKDVLVEDAVLQEEPKKDQMADGESGVGCGGGSEQSVQSGPGQSTVTGPNSATEGTLSCQENEQGEAGKLTRTETADNAGYHESVLKLLDSYDQILSQVGEAKTEDHANDVDESSLLQKENIVRQAKRNLRNLPHLPSPSDIARVYLKPGFSLMNSDAGSREASETHLECLNRKKDARLGSLFSNFERLHNEIETLQESLGGLASGSLSSASYNKMFEDTQKDMQSQIQLLREVTQSNLSSGIKKTSKQNEHSAAEMIPNEQPEAESKEKKDEGELDVASSGGEMEWEEEEEEEEEEIEEGDEQQDSEDREDRGEVAEGEDKSSKANSKTLSQKTLAKKTKRQKQTGAQSKKRKVQTVKADPIQPGQLICVEVTHTSTVVDVLWQDGSYETGIISTDVVPCRQLDELEFFPGDVVSFGKDYTEDGYGVITKADNKERTCGVSWITRNPENPSQPLTSTEEHSVYELSPHQDFVFSTDDVVVRIAHNSKEEEESAQDLPPAGQVQVVNGDGSITIRWVDDTLSKVFPHQLYRIEEDCEFDSELSITDYLEAAKEMIKEGGGGGGDSSHDNTSSDSSWETASGKSGDEGHEEDEEDVCEDEMSLVPGDSVTISKTEPPDTEAQRTGEVETADKTEKPMSTNSDCSVLQQSSTDIVEGKEHDAVSQEEISDIQTEGRITNIKSEKEQVEMKLEITPATEEEVPVNQDKDLSWAEDGLQSPNAASRFIVVSSLPECHYFSSAQEPTNQKQFLQTWKKEVRLLQTALPQGILVKAFEDRMDMFSVMIEGPVNTPYEDGVFFFDIRLLGDYPKTPPKVHYLSFCSGRLNPNLYSDGKVCLSLLGTWSGKGNEMWTSSSNLLQLLVSVQGLILVNEPYYNEAGYDKHRGTTESMENCRMYNEMALVKLVQSMSKMVSSPPFLFKEEALLFCKKHCARLIRRLESWLDLALRSEDIPKAMSQPSAETCPGPPCQQDQVMQPNEEATIKTGSTEDGASSSPKESVCDVPKAPIPPPSSSSSSSFSSSSSSSNTSKPDSVLHLPSDPATETTSASQTAISPPSTTVTAPSSSPEATQPCTSSISASPSKPERTTLEPGWSQIFHGAGASFIPDDGSISLPPYSLFPLSKGFIISLQHTLSEFKSQLKQAGIS